MKENGVAGQKLGVDFIDINMIQIFGDEKIDWTDGMTPMMEARAVKNQDEHECMRQVGAIGDAAHWEFMKFLKPGLTENQLTAHIMEFLYNVPGMEDVEDVIVSSGLNTWPNWRNFSDRIIKPGDMVFMDLAARAGMSGIQEWLSFYFKSPMTAPALYPEHDLFIQLMKLKNTLRYMMGEELITHLGREYYD